MDRLISPGKIVLNMLKNDHFSKWLNIELLAISLGKCTLRMQVTKPMLNGFQIAHGGISYSLADSCLAFAANSYGNKCVSINTSIKHLKKVTSGDYLTAKAEEISRSEKRSSYEISISNQRNEIVATFKGEMHISSARWEVD